MDLMVWWYWSVGCSCIGVRGAVVAGHRKVWR
jgi:hypothetical protein